MAIQFDEEFERRIREAAQRQGLPVEGFVRSTLLREIEALDRSARKRERDRWLLEEMRKAAADPLFIQDNEEVMRDFAAADAEAFRMIPDD